MPLSGRLPRLRAAAAVTAARAPRPARHRRRRARGTVAAALVAAVLGALTVSGPPASGSPEAAGDPRCALDEQLVADCGLLWGIYTNREGRGNLYRDITGIEEDAGRPFDVVHRYKDFSGTGASGVFPTRYEQRLGEEGRILFYNWTTRRHDGAGRATWDDVAAGLHDERVVRPAARRLARWDRPVFLAFDHEAEGERHPNQGEGEDYVRAWRHVHEIFEEEGADNVRWVWVSVGWTGHADVIRSFYPGDAYVDWIGWDPFNYYVCRNLDWRTPEETIGPWYEWLEDNGFGDKPWMLAEYGSVADPRDPEAEARWYRNLVPALRRYPRIRAVNLFDTHKKCDTRVTDEPAVMEEWSAAGRHPYVSRYR
ncbi:glycosyl hydrolase [Streptomyces sp. DSM 44917]|uniref:Glycosyl hydrolase n=1 Tax=Streptomyces boetiae TaxID=3075541 RepID=A0ABU2L5E0_9ACTN|nr:glycosyl hydrolase [Streptomyces sp. DSM 44917]MDT0306768.1 glycosyl hydrolase [Streptomyces sp. DSM 44917]